MQPRELLRQLKAQGVSLSLSGDNLKYRAPQGTLTDDLRDAIRQHKAELLDLLRGDVANDKLTPCPVCDDPERWPTTRGPVCPTCWLAKSAPEPKPTAPQWRTERDLSHQSVGTAFQRYVAEAHGGTMPDLAYGALLSKFNLWLEAQGERATTLPVLRLALGIQAARSEKPQGYIKRCGRCGGAEWGPSGRHAADGCEVWWCMTCNNNE